MNPTTNGTYEEFPLGHATRILVLDYFDGPTEGVVRFDSGDEYQFLQTIAA